ncbi:hypothetical protein [Variovorax paradoxus]|uniref:hypothetical protein n=1 Tax=Variovorax paradoxus TaxID=34073 RepID=UPI003D65BE48
MTSRSAWIVLHLAWSLVVPAMAAAECSTTQPFNKGIAAGPWALGIPIEMPNGKTPGTAVFLDMDPDQRLPLSLTDGSTCYLRFEVRLPISVEFDFGSDAALSELSVRVATIATTPLWSAEGVRSQDGRRIAFDLPEASYLLQVSRAAAPSDAIGAARVSRHVLSIAAARRTAPRFPLIAGAEAPLMLDPVSRTAVREIIVERRSLVRFSLTNVVEPAQWERRLSIGLRDAAERVVPAAVSSGPDDRERRATYILQPGIYYVEAEVRFNGSPSPILGPPLRSRIFGLRVDAINEAAPSSQMQALSSWLNEVGLGSLVEFSESLDLRNPSENIPGAHERLHRYAKSVAILRSKTANKQFENDPQALYEANDGFEWPHDVDERDQPQLVILFRVKADRGTFTATENAFEKAHGTGMWNRLLQNASALHGISARKIVMVAPVPCDPHLVYLSDGEASRHGGSCVSATSSTPLSLAAGVSDAAHVSSTGLNLNLAEVTPRFLRRFFAGTDAAFDFLNTEDEHVEVIVRGLRGYVIRGGHDWEKLQLTISLTRAASGSSPTLRVTADGHLSSGIGSYPSDTQFESRSIAAGGLTDISKRVANELRNFVLHSQRLELP